MDILLNIGGIVLLILVVWYLYGRIKAEDEAGEENGYNKTGR